MPKESCAANVSDPILSISSFDRRVENVLWNPSADGILAVSSATVVKIYDVTCGADNEVFSKFITIMISFTTFYKSFKKQQ